MDTLGQLSKGDLGRWRKCCARLEVVQLGVVEDMTLETATQIWVEYYAEIDRLQQKYAHLIGGEALEDVTFMPASGRIIIEDR